MIDPRDDGASKKQPWLKFFPTDWRSDPALRMCSPGARGLWIEMICLMHEATPQGSLLINGRQISERQLANLAGFAIDETEILLRELEEAGVFSRDQDGTIFSRRVRRDAERARIARQNGRQGGNPSLVRRDNAGVNPSDKAQKPEARSQRPEARTHTPEAAAAAAAARNDMQAKCEAAAGCQNLRNFSAIVALVDGGADLEGRILPIIRDVASELQREGKQVSSWGYFAEAISDPDRRPTISPAATPSVFIEAGTPQADAWARHAFETTGKRLFMTEVNKPGGGRAVGRYELTEWPPIASGAEDERYPQGSITAAVAPRAIAEYPQEARRAGEQRQRADAGTAIGSVVRSLTRAAP